MTKATSTTHQRSMDRRLGVTDRTAIPVPRTGDGHNVDTFAVERSLAPIPPRLLPDTAMIAPGGHLEIGGVDIIDLAEAVGTPVFIYDETHLRLCRLRDYADFASALERVTWPAVVVVQNGSA